MDYVKDVVSSIRAGDIVLLVDEDVEREGEADFVVAASFVTPQQVSFLAHKGGGLLCVAMPPGWANRLSLLPMTDLSSDPLGTGWLMSVDYRGTGSGISAYARSTTVRALADPQTRGEDFSRPGHVFPLRAREGGLRERKGHTEASLELMRLAGMPPVALICELMMPNGHMANAAEAEDFAREYDLKICSISDVVREPSSL